MAPTLKLHKVVAALPGVLEADSVYFVRVGTGFTMYVTNSSGTIVAYTPNLGWADIQGKPTTLAGYGITDAYTSLAVQSRGMNLVTNGTGLMGNNYNFSQGVFTRSELYTGGGSFKSSVRNHEFLNDELIPVIPELAYQFRAALKSTFLAANNATYAFAILYDIAGDQMQSGHYNWTPGTTTTLAQPLKVGDTVIYLASAANWATGTTAAARYIKIHRYVNQYGYVWAPETYSRNISALNMYANAGVDTVNNTITLSTPWALANPEAGSGGVWPVGTPMGVSPAGGGRSYFTNINNTPIPASWTTVSGVINGLSKDGSGDNYKFQPGTAFIRIGFSMNRMLNTANTYPTPGNETAVSGVYLSEIASPTLTGGLAGYSGSFKDQSGKTVTVTNGLITSVV